MNFIDIFNQVKDTPGWMGESDCRALHEYTKDLVNANILEIGSFMGISTKVMALSSSTSKITAIDPYLTVHESSGLSDTEGVMNGFLDNVKGLNVKLIRDKSENVEWNEPIDFLHIDGDHHYKALMADVKKYVPFVKKGCYVFFHDYTVAREDPEENGSRVRDVVEDSKHYFSEIKTVSGFACCKI